MILNIINYNRHIAFNFISRLSKKKFFFPHNNLYKHHNYSIVQNNEYIHTSSSNMSSDDTSNFKIITQEELEANDGIDGNKLWICINGIVYDVTNFNEHPGGMDAFIEVAGKDASEAFEDVGHSATAYELMDEYAIGKLAIDNDK